MFLKFNDKEPPKPGLVLEVLFVKILLTVYFLIFTCKGNLRKLI